MAYTQQEIEYYHDMGLMPDWVYYQQNGKSAQENYNVQKKADAVKKRRELKESESLEKYVSDLLEKKLDDSLNKVLDDFLKNFK